jgi:hypothetical protein
VVAAVLSRRDRRSRCACTRRGFAGIGGTQSGYVRNGQPLGLETLIWPCKEIIRWLTPLAAPRIG